MVPSGFQEANTVLNPPYGVDLDDCEAINVFQGRSQDGIQVVISCWKITQKELEELKKTGRVWLWVWGRPMPPVALGTDHPFFLPESEPDRVDN